MSTIIAASVPDEIPIHMDNFRRELSTKKGNIPTRSFMLLDALKWAFERPEEFRKRLER